MNVSVTLPDEKDLCLSVKKGQLVAAQQSDCSLAKCVSAAQSEEGASQTVSFLYDDCVLLRKWVSVAGMECDAVRQVVVPTEFRSQVLSLAHDHALSGHLGIKKNIQLSAPLLFLAWVKI